MKKPGEFRVVNHSVQRGDGTAKVTGRAIFSGDLTLEGMAWAKVLRSPFAHARIVSIDTSQAKKCPGVHAVITGADLTDIDPYYGHSLKDHPVLAIGKVRFAGEPVAAVVAVDELTAQEALDDIQVEYEELPALMDVDSALAVGAALIHDRDYSEGSFRGFEEQRDASGNLCQKVHIKWGDVDAALASAAHVVEGEFYFPMAYAYAMEPYVAIADYTDRGLNIYACAQHPFMVRSDLARIFNLPLNQVRLIVPLIGGGYGSKSYTKIEPIAAVCSKRIGHPVKFQCSVEEAMLTTRGDDARVRIRTAVDAEGRLVARQATIHLNTGAYAENSPLVCKKAASRILGAYRFPNFEVEGYAVYTNTVPASSYRGFGAAQVVFPGESQMEQLAEKLGMDPLEFRLKNLVRRGETINPKLRALDADLLGDLQKAHDMLERHGPVAPGRGRAIGCAASDSGAYPVTSALVQVYGDGSVSVLSGSTEIGQGSHTVLAQIAAEEMGTPYEKVRVVASDTGITPFERSTGASRTTSLMGRAVLEACREAIAQLNAMAVSAYQINAEEITEEPGGIVCGDQHYTWGDILEKYFQLRDCSIVGRCYLKQAGDLSKLPPFWEVGVVGVEVSVDRETGQVRLETLATVGDVGLAINPAMAEGQDMGSATMGLGLGLFEELIYDGQQLTNGSLLEYRVPRFSDLAAKVDMQLVQNQDGTGPYGAKGGGESSLNPLPSCLANAVYRATGARMYRLPLTPERVWRALQEKSEAGHHAESGTVEPSFG